MLVSVAPCGRSEDRSGASGESLETAVKVDIDELKSLDGMMLEVTATVSDPYYDAEGTPHEIYNGCIYGNEDLLAVVETIGMYSVD